LFEGDTVQFYYTTDGVRKLRSVEIDSINIDDELIVGKLIYPEQDNVGEYRSFKVSKVEDLRYLND